MKWFKSLYYVIVSLVTACLLLSGCSVKVQLSSTQGKQTASFDRAVSADTKAANGDILESGSFFEIDNVTILYDGNMFLVQNRGSVAVRVNSRIVGVKHDGSYEKLQLQPLTGLVLCKL